MNRAADQKRHQRGAPASRGGKFAAEGKSTETGVDLGAEGQEPHGSAAGFTAAPDALVADRSAVFDTRFDTMEEKLKAVGDEVSEAFARFDGVNDAPFKRYLAAAARFHKYSAQNQMLIAIQTKGRATRVAGKNRWAEMGRKRKPGEKGIVIYAPVTKRVPVVDKNGHRVLDDDGKEKWRPRVVAMTTTVVYDVAQTEGDPLPDWHERRLSETPPDGFVNDMESAAEAAGYTVRYEDLKSYDTMTAHGWTDPGKKEIVVDSAMTPAEQAHTLGHELGHVYAGHTDPENDGKYHSGPGGCRGQFEVEANTTAYMLMRRNGMSDESLGDNVRYNWNWAGGNGEVIKASTDNAVKAARKALESTSFRNLDDPDPVTQPAQRKPRTAKSKTSRSRKTTRRS